MPRTVAFLNKKGGVGKTSTVHHLGGTLARRGLRCLVVDADPQASLTQGLLGPDVAESLDPRETIAGLFDDAPSNPAALVRPTPFPGLSLLAGCEAAEDFNDPRPWESGLRQFVLRDALAELGDGFDLVLIDCPPHVQFWAWSCAGRRGRCRRSAPGRRLRCAGTQGDQSSHRSRADRSERGACLGRLPGHDVQ